jgi:CRP/FNR family transcriptional regulator, nitrogen oxide reductase regulator
MTRFLSDGKASTACVLTEGETFCCLSTLDQKPYPADAVAATDCVVLQIPTRILHEAMSRSASFMQDALCLFCDRLRQVEEKGCMVFEPAERRFAQILLTLSKKFGSTIPLTRQELAEMAGTAHETAIRTISRFNKLGIIRSARGKTTILKSEKLAAILQ